MKYSEEEKENEEEEEKKEEKQDQEAHLEEIQHDVLIEDEANKTKPVLEHELENEVPNSNEEQEEEPQLESEKLEIRENLKSDGNQEEKYMTLKKL